MIHAQIFVGEAGVGGISQGAEGFDEFHAAGVDEEAAGSRRVEEGGVDAGDFVADFPGISGAGDCEAGFAEDVVVGGANAAGFAGAAGGVGARDDAALHAEASLDFFAEVPGGGAAAHDDFVEDPGVSHNAGGARVVIEEFLDGEEASFIVMCDGKTVLPLATSQDHKRLQDADLGPNTGGMGAYSPAPVVTPQVHSRVMREIIIPTIKGMEQDGIPFTGFLYAGLMIDKTGHVKTLEFNCRMGDPETQPIMMRLKSDLVDVLMAATEPHPAVPLQDFELQWDRQSAVGVVMASHGYPATSRSGDVISGLPADVEDTMVFHAATKMDANQVVTSGGRVLCVCALGGTLKLAQQKAYETLHHIQFDGMQFRRDIGYRAIQR